MPPVVTAFGARDTNHNWWHLCAARSQTAPRYIIGMAFAWCCRCRCRYMVGSGNAVSRCARWIPKKGMSHIHMHELLMNQRGQRANSREGNYLCHPQRCFLVCVCVCVPNFIIQCFCIPFWLDLAARLFFASVMHVEVSIDAANKLQLFHHKRYTTRRRVTQSMLWFGKCLLFACYA